VEGIYIIETELKDPQLPSASNSGASSGVLLD